MISFCYVDRQKSSVGSSEKAQVVHSANWKEQIHLKKELELLQRQESEAMKRIRSDQRMVAHKFLCRILHSIENIKAIEKMKEEIKESKYQTNQNYDNDKNVSSTTISSLPKLASITERPISGLNGKVCKRECMKIRPVTASEMQGRAWERRIILMAKNIQRTKSASLRTRQREETIRTSSNQN